MPFSSDSVTRGKQGTEGRNF